jgi:hypothetical protein
MAEPFQVGHLVALLEGFAFVGHKDREGKGRFFESRIKKRGNAAAALEMQASGLGSSASGIHLGRDAWPVDDSLGARALMNPGQVNHLKRLVLLFTRLFRWLRRA